MGYVPKAGDRIRVVNRNDAWSGATGTALGRATGTLTRFHEVSLDEGRDIFGNPVSGGNTWAKFCTDQLEKIDAPVPTDTSIMQFLLELHNAGYEIVRRNDYS